MSVGYCPQCGNDFGHKSNCPSLYPTYEKLESQNAEHLATFTRHTEAVKEFLNELYAIMVDPCTEGSITVSEIKEALIKAAIRDRDTTAEHLATIGQLQGQVAMLVDALETCKTFEAVMNWEKDIQSYDREKVKQAISSSQPTADAFVKQVEARVLEEAAQFFDGREYATTDRWYYENLKRMAADKLK